jgi:hypothetical protein
MCNEENIIEESEEKEEENKYIPNKIVLPREYLLELAVNIINEFEGLLDDKGIEIENPEKQENMTGDKKNDESIANIYGEDYYTLEDAVLELLKKYLNVHMDDEE